jgi:hypothetical protein
VFAFARHLLVAALLISIGGHWALLQSVAWVGMAVNYSIDEGSVATGLKKTFDGNHPCPLCKLVDKGLDSEKKPEPKVKTFKLDLFLTTRVIVLSPPQFREIPRALNEVAEPRTARPPAPPPRGPFA